MPEPKPSLDDVYKEIGTNYRHFASWRQKIFAGYLTIIAAMSIAFWTIRDHSMARVILVAAIVVSIVFLLLDRRNWEITNACLEAGVSCESQIDAPFRGCYSSLSGALGHFMWSHTAAIWLLFLGVAAGSVWMLATLEFRPQGQLPRAEVLDTSHSADSPVQSSQGDPKTKVPELSATTIRNAPAPLPLHAKEPQASVMWTGGRVIAAYLIACIVGHFVTSWCVRRLWNSIDKEQRAHTSPPLLAFWQGVSERALYTSAILLGKPEGIAVWLAYKAVMRWKLGDNDMVHVPGGAIYVIGTIVSLGFGVIGGLIGTWRLAL